MSPGIFLVFEGIDGSGKDTVLNKLLPRFFTEGETSNLFQSKYTEILRTREPTIHTQAGREIALALKNQTLLEKNEILELYMQDRIQHSTQIRELLERGTIVLCSRYDLSSFAYQQNMGYSFEQIYDMHKYGSPSGALIPHITLYFDLNAKEALRRIDTSGRGREALEREEFLEKTQSSYLQAIERLKEKDGRTIYTINANDTPENVLKQTLEKLSNDTLLNNRKNEY